MKEIISTIHRPPRRSRVYCRASDPSPSQTTPRNRVLVGDALEELGRLPDHCIDTVVTSPPYHLLRKYGGGDAEIGTATHVDDYVNQIVAVCDELARVLKHTGTLWLNLGDSFARAAKYGAPPKGMLLAPERILLALAGRGWIVRSKVVWSKPNYMPSSARDRLTTSWEPLYLLVRSSSYFFDLDAIRIPHTSTRGKRRTFRGLYDTTKYTWAGPLAGKNDGLMRAHAEGRVGHPLGKNPGDVWRIPTAGFRGAHFAVFPERLVEQPIVAGCPERTCETCGTPWHRPPGERTAPLTATCDCNAEWTPGLVLDPFLGSGTVGVVARRLGRDWLGVELNSEYATLARLRIEEAPLGRSPP